MALRQRGEREVLIEDSGEASGALFDATGTWGSRDRLPCMYGVYIEPCRERLPGTPRSNDPELTTWPTHGVAALCQFFSVERVSGISAYETDWLS
jgi:hypothetical protein